MLKLLQQLLELCGHFRWMLKRLLHLLALLQQLLKLFQKPLFNGCGSNSGSC